MNTPLISILHPTARVSPSELFPLGWREACDQFYANCDFPNRVEYIVAVHESRWNEFWLKFDGEVPYGSRLTVPIIGYRWPSILVVKNTGRDCVVDQINAAAFASSGKLLVGVMDDLRAPAHWDTQLLRALVLSDLPRPELVTEGHLSEKDEDFKEILSNQLTREMIILCSSGATAERDRELFICGAMTRARYERYGFVLDPEFESMYADNWYAHVARRDEAAGLVKIVERLDIRFDHQHRGVGSDGVYKLQNSPAAYFHGYNTFARKVGLPVRRALAVCLPGEEFRMPWVARWTALFGHLTQNRQMLVAPFFGHTSNVYCTRITLANEVLAAEVPFEFSLWIDDDNTLMPEQFDMLLADLDSHPELAGVVGWCWCDNHQDEASDANRWTMSVGRQGPNMECYRFGLEDFQKAEGFLLGTDQIAAPDGFWSGFPVVLLRTSALRQLGGEAFAPIFRPDINFGFSGEDTAFFWRARQAGLKFAVDVRVKVPHVKWRVIEPVFSAPNSASVPAATDERVAVDGD